MEIYLVQHAEAKSEEEDAQRPLTEKGTKEAGRVAEGLEKAGIKAPHIMHSGKLRAKQTAEIFSNHMGPSIVREMLGLQPNDNPLIAKTFLESAKEPVMLVGHMPHLTKLASLLLTGNSDHEMVDFQKGGVVCLEKTEKWVLKWVLTPEITPIPIKQLFPMGSRRDRAAGRTAHPPSLP
jgi:phosphohistidine phosphatase